MLEVQHVGNTCLAVIEGAVKSDHRLQNTKAGKPDPATVGRREALLLPVSYEKQHCAMFSEPMIRKCLSIV